MLIAKKFYMRI